MVFHLIIFLRAAAHLAGSEPTERVGVPVANPREETTDSPRRLTVTVAAGPRFWIAGQEQPREIVEATILTEAEREGSGPLELRIRTDRVVPFGEVEPLMLTAAKAGVTNVKFPVIPREAEND